MPIASRQLIVTHNDAVFDIGAERIAVDGGDRTGIVVLNLAISASYPIRIVT